MHHPLKLARKQIKRADNQMIMADIKTIKADKLAKQQELRTGDTTAVKLAQTNLLADKAKFKKDIHEASQDDTKHIPFIRVKS